ncbi:thioesterase [Mycolicibacterium duvalii]|uniref:Thioesterase n=1 Tax=Mycolicibacterium duvalii TaxID=39688 RepID=A0A7I7JVV5_9MYCO|nr:PaaI family thioesterase [Mycolicibacterium duvalii]MCV7369914.1 PaaI family thioesterase [Mycolicibacterium duvalii]PEG38297.1 thioesterase [Mycolicibacterium duvalii]BBX15986.1 thioesterase [Mycolicibacterium duvalii]
MDFSFDAISAEEYERLRSSYEPLTDALRTLIDVGIHTEVDDETVQEALTHLQQAAALLQRRQRDGRSTLRHADTGRPVAWANPAVGLRNAIAPPMIIEQEPDGSCWSEFTLGPAYEGPPGWVHGGICALVLDHILGEVASEGLLQPKFTGTISLRYLRGTPLGPLRAEAFVERSEGVKTFARGYLLDSEGATVEAEGVFIKPAWARDAG